MRLPQNYEYPSYENGAGIIFRNDKRGAEYRVFNGYWELNIDYCCIFSFFKDITIKGNSK